MGIRRVLLQRSSMLNRIDSGKHRFIVEICNKNCPVGCGELLSIRPILHGLVEVELWAAVAPKFIRCTAPGGSTVFVTDETNIGEWQFSFSQDRIEHYRHGG